VLVLHVARQLIQPGLQAGARGHCSMSQRGWAAAARRPPGRVTASAEGAQGRRGIRAVARVLASSHTRLSRRAGLPLPGTDGNQGMLWQQAAV
jgi:hypothetical protein